MVKNPPAMQETQETWVWSLGQEDLLEEGIATHSSILAWRIPWLRSLTDYSPQGHKELDTTEVTEHTHMRQDSSWIRKKTTLLEINTVMDRTLCPPFERGWGFFISIHCTCVMETVAVFLIDTVPGYDKKCIYGYYGCSEQRAGLLNSFVMLFYIEVGKMLKAVFPRLL